jgi:uncharacterized membrane protein YdjX (TVP38/TMEM64 family)
MNIQGRQVARRFAGVLLVLLVVLLAPLMVTDTLAYGTSLLTAHRDIAGVLYLAMMFVASVVAPIGATPLIPIVAPIIGPFATAVYSVIGWTVGAIVAFCIARYGGKPLLERFVNMERVYAYERMIPQRTQFLAIVLLRILVPVDFISYAIGLLSSVSLWQYSLATFIGVIPLSVILPYASTAALSQRYSDMLLLIAGLVAVLLTSWFAYRILTRQER